MDLQEPAVEKQYYILVAVVVLCMYLFCGNSCLKMSYYVCCKVVLHIKGLMHLHDVAYVGYKL